MGRSTRFRKRRHTGATTAMRTRFPNHHKATGKTSMSVRIPSASGLYAGRLDRRKSVENIERRPPVFGTYSDLALTIWRGAPKGTHRAGSPPLGGQRARIRREQIEQ